MRLSKIKEIIMKRPLLSGGLALLCLIGLGVSLFKKQPEPPAPMPITIRASLVSKGDVPRFYHGLGTVTALQDTIIRSRVDGYLTAIHFKEGQYVKEGAILVEIDPRPFQNKLAEAKGALIKDEALLKNARQDLERYKKLLRQDAIPIQQVQSQEALVGQYEGAVIQDKAAIAEAELQLSYSRVTAPFSGKTGLRQVDIGATISSSDSAGIVRLTQTQPCYVVFTLVDKYLPHVREAIRTKRLASREAGQKKSEHMKSTYTESGYAESGDTESGDTESGQGKSAYDGTSAIDGLGLEVSVWSQDGKTRLCDGYLQSLDNQIDLNTGTIKAKALIPNEANRLYPNQFVNVQLHVDTMRDVLTIPAAAVQRNNTGYFVYTIAEDKAKLRPITIDYSNDILSVVSSGLSEGELVVTDGMDNLRDGTPIRYTLENLNSSGDPNTEALNAGDPDTGNPNTGAPKS